MYLQLSKQLDLAEKALIFLEALKESKQRQGFCRQSQSLLINTYLNIKS